ncbi:putative cyclase [Mycobacterium sp. BK086]|nr:putative cyclase [Mycobacterium sp. BK086]
MTARWKRRPQGSNWGEFGPDDTLGRLNMIRPQQVLRGIAEVREGQVFSLSLPLTLPGGMALNANRFPPIVRPTTRAGAVNFNCPMSVAIPGATDVMSDDFVVLHTQYSTQWDAFGHAGAAFDADADSIDELLYYNGWRAGVDVIGPQDSGAAGLSSLTDVDGAATGSASTSNAGPVDITHMARHGVQGRAVLVDLAAHLGIERTIVDFDTFAGILAKDNVVVEPGDILVLHTGFAREVLAQDGRPSADSLNVCAVLDGADQGLHEWIDSSGVAAIAADNYAVEVFPPTTKPVGAPALPLHELCLFRLGVHLGELWWLSELATYLRSAGRSRFLVTAPPLRLPGATGSPVTPIATV